MARLSTALVFTFQTAAKRQPYDSLLDTLYYRSTLPFATQTSQDRSKVLLIFDVK